MSKRAPSISVLMTSTAKNATSASIQYGGSYLLEAVQSFCQEEKAAGNPRDELKRYLESGPEPTTDVIGWWGHQSESRYPTMRRIARDYLAIQGSATPSERAFSSGGITGTARRNSLSTNIFEALQILKSAYRNQHVAAVHQAAGHVDALIAALDGVDCSSDGEE
jgi:hAT family C-terminal dimerisation region